MNRRLAVVLTSAVFLATGPEAGAIPDGPPTPEREPVAQDHVAFDATPETNFSVNDCNGDPNVWVKLVDGMPDKAMTPEDKQTIGLVAEYDNEGRPVIEIGAAIRGLGGFAYEIATSDGGEETHEIDLDDGISSIPIEGNPDTGYDAVLTAKREKEVVSFILYCLPDIDFHGDGQKVPLDPPGFETPIEPFPGPSEDEYITV